MTPKQYTVTLNIIGATVALLILEALNHFGVLSRANSYGAGAILIVLASAQVFLFVQLFIQSNRISKKAK